MELFATNLRKRTKELGISHSEAARRIGLGEQRYGNYINARREPDLATFVRIAAILETTPDKLLGFAPDQGSVKAGVKDRILAAANVLPQRDLEAVAVMIEALADRRVK